MDRLPDKKPTLWLPVTTAIAAGAYVLPLCISYFLYDTHGGPDKVYWRIVIFWQTFGIGLHAVSAVAALCAAVIWAFSFRGIPLFAFRPFGVITGGVVVSVLALLFYGWSGLFR